MSRTLEMNQRHHLGQVPHVQRIRRRNKTDIPRYNTLLKFLFGSRHDIMQHAPAAELFNKISFRAHTGDKDSKTAKTRFFIFLFPLETGGPKCGLLRKEPPLFYKILI